jgi:murein DD-endopeptidase MepM/ murein hydrolase activator NlpD
MPVVGWKSSDFGERYDPYYRVWQLHAGTDFAAPGGSPIRAAAAGRVIQAGWNGGYGNYTCISHGRLQGRGFSTCYGHQSAILVHIGERVSRGEVIGRGRHHRRVDRLPPALRDALRRRTEESAPLSAAMPVLTRG